MELELTRAKMKIIKNFIQTIDKDLKVRKSKMFLCDIYGKKVYVCENREPRDFEEWLATKIDFKPNWFVISLLHEIGHIMTNSEELEKEKDVLYSLYLFMYRNGEIDTKAVNYKYFEIPMEYNATMWGVEFYRNNFTLCETLAEMLGVND